MSTLSQFAGGCIKSIQRGILDIPAGTSMAQNVTISSVNVSRCVATASTALSSTNYGSGTAITITSSTNITVATFYGGKIYWEVVEYE